MTDIYQTRSLVVISKGGTVSTISSTDITVNRLLTEGFDTAVVLWDYPDNPDDVPALDSTINIYMRKGTAEIDNQVFSGKISAIRKQSRGLEHRWLELDCWGWGKYLTDRIWKGRIKDLGHDCINTVVAELVDEGLLYTGGVSVSAEQIIVDAKNGKVIMDILRDDICSGEANKLDWDFYVDFGKTLNAFQRGIRETGLNIASLSLSFDYEESVENCINVQTVWGVSNTIMNDASLTDNSPGWTSNANLYNASSVKTAGTYSLYAELANGANPIWLKQTYPTALDLSEGGILRFDYKYWVRQSWEAEHPNITITVYLMSDDSNYVHLTFVEGGAFNERRDTAGLTGQWVHLPWGYCVIVFDWHPTELTFNKLADKEWGEVGNIDWSAITAMSFDIVGPLSIANHPNKFYIDNATIEASYYGQYSVSTNYDVRVGKPKKTRLESNEACVYLSSLIVEAYKDPQLKIENLELSKNFDVDIGDNVIFNTLDINCTLTVRSIEHKLQDFDLKTRVELSPRYIPSPERMTALFQRQLEDLNFNLEAYRLISASKGVIPGRGFIDWWEIDTQYSPVYMFTSKKFISLPLESLLKYKDLSHTGGACTEYPPGGVQLVNPDGDTAAGFEASLMVDNCTIMTALKFYSKIDYQQDAGVLVVNIGYEFPHPSIGFQFSWGTICATWSDGSTYDVQGLQAFDTSTWYMCQADYIYEEDKAYYWIDGECKATLGVTMPTTIGSFYAQNYSGGGTIWLKGIQLVTD